MYEYGERLVDRIDFEELALKGIDPSIGPTITHPDVTGSESSGSKVSESVRLPTSLPDVSLIYRLPDTLAISPVSVDWPGYTRTPEVAGGPPGTTT